LMTMGAQSTAVRAMRTNAGLTNTLARHPNLRDHVAYPPRAPMSRPLQDHTIPPSAEFMSSTTKSIALATAGIVVIVYSVARVNWFPAISPDGLNYLDHSNDLIGTGFVQFGFRQFAYPGWLALVDWIARIGSIDPLGLTVILQRLLLIAAAGVAVLVLRWWSAPIVFVVLSPSAIALSNYILTETIAFPLAVTAAAASVAILQYRPRTHTALWLGVATAAGVVLPMIRLHYALISLAIAVAVFAAGRVRGETRRQTIAALSIMGLTLSVLVGALALENRQENGVLLPSIGAERQMFWMTWETVVVLHRNEVARAMPDVYLDGSTSAFIRKMDGSNLSSGEQRAVYESAVDRIYAATGVSQVGERFRSSVGVITGSRVDDLANVLRFIASSDAPTNSDSYIHQYGSVTVVDPDMIGTRYNGGAPPVAVLTAADVVPAFPTPGLNVMMSYIIPMMLVIGVYLLRFAKARLMAAIAIGVVLAYSAASFAFMMDNLRFLLPAYVFSITFLLGALREYWLYDRSLTSQPNTSP